MKLLIAVMLSIVFVATASAADATGTWSGKLNVTGPDGQQQEDTVYLILKQDGGKLTGTAGPSADQQLPIDKGSVTGNKVSFEVALGQATFKFDIALADDHLKGDVALTAGGQTMKANMDATRVK